MYSLPLAAVTVPPLRRVVVPAEKEPSSLRVTERVPPEEPRATDCASGATYAACHRPPCRVSRYTLLLLPVRVSPLASGAPPAEKEPFSLRVTERMPPEEPRATNSAAAGTNAVDHSPLRFTVRRYVLPFGAGHVLPLVNGCPFNR